MTGDHHPHRQRRVRRLAFLAFLLVSVCVTRQAKARAGGGGGFSGGGGGGGGGGGSPSGGGGGGGGFSSGGGGSYGSGRQDERSYRNPSYSSGPDGERRKDGLTLPILFTVFAAVAVVIAELTKPKIEERSIRRAKREADQLTLDGMLQGIQDADPAFRSDAFLRRASRAFRVLQRAWSKQDLTPIHRFVSDAVHERFSLQIAEMKERGTRNVMEGVRVREATIATGGVDRNFQAITVRFQASAIDYEVNTAGRVTSGTKSREGFVEYWSFVRRPGAKTRDADGLFEGHCPNCGSPLQLNQTESCKSCNAKVRNGRYDWILTEITQASEWKPRPQTAVPGVGTMAANDPGFCLQHLEDRASVVFWRRIAAWQAGKTLPLQKMATPTYCKTMEKDLRPDPDGTRPIPSGAAVGSVETEGILCEAPLDQALVRIHWSSGTDLLRPDGTQQRTIGVRFHVSFLLLTRKHGVKGNMDDALSSAHCPGCGAPVTNTVADACEYCGDAMANGEQDWRLANVCVAEEKPVRELLSQLQGAKPRKKSKARSREAVRLPLDSGRELIAWAVHVMLADNVIDEAEEKLLEALATKHGVQEADLKRLVLAAQAGELELGIPEEADATRACLEAMAEMALVDGSVTAAERETMHTIGRRLGFGKREIAKTITRARRRLARQGKQRLKALRRKS